MNLDHIAFLAAPLVAAIALSGCQSTPNATSSASSATTSSNVAPPSNAPAGAAPSDTVVLTVHGMSCPLCATNVDKQLLKVPGVQAVKVDLNTGIIQVQIDESQPPSSQSLIDAVNESGFTLVGEPE